ncbi:hypothetical protein K439DRAFT_1619752 [Ramaria rubella]|nr:hypothetical protein K439DRAFT_1619752 [Ramaria rubella]
MTSTSSCDSHLRRVHVATTAGFDIPRHLQLLDSHKHTRLEEYNHQKRARDDIHTSTVPQPPTIEPSSPTISSLPSTPSTKSSFSTLLSWATTPTNPPTPQVRTPHLPNMSASAATLCPTFHGNGHDGEDSKSWFKTFRRSTVDWDDPKKLENFDLYLEDEADKWWASAAGIACSTTWAAALAGFLTHFPSIPNAKEGQGIQFERLTRCVLTHQELGDMTWDDRKKKEVLNHTTWAQKIVRLAAAYGDTTAATLPFIRIMCLPPILNKLLDENYDSFAVFAEAVGNIKLEHLHVVRTAADTIDTLKLAVDAGQRDAACLQAWAAKPHNTVATLQNPWAFPVTPLPMSQQPRRFNTPATPATSTGPMNMPVTVTPMNRFNPFWATPQTNLGSPFDRDAPVLPHNNTMVDLVPFPESPEGGTKHGTALIAWQTKLGDSTFPGLDHPYPLLPSTNAVGSQECFRCG